MKKNKNDKIKKNTKNFKIYTIGGIKEKNKCLKDNK